MSRVFQVIAEGFNGFDVEAEHFNIMTKDGVPFYNLYNGEGTDANTVFVAGVQQVLGILDVTEQRARQQAALDILAQGASLEADAAPGLQEE